MSKRQVDNIKVNIDKATKAMLAQVETALRSFLERMKADIDSDLRAKNVRASGELMKNIRSALLKETGKIIGVVGVGPNVPYGIYVHEGAKPHYPPVEPIQQWVILKGLVKIGGKATTHAAIHRRKNADAIMSGVKSIAIAIVRKIGHKGTKAVPFLRTALNLNRNYLMAEMAKVKV